MNPNSVIAKPITRELDVIIGRDEATVIDHVRGHAVIIEGDLADFAAGGYASRYDYATLKKGVWVVEAIDPSFDRPAYLTKGRRVRVAVTLVRGHWNSREAVRTALRPRRWTF